MSQPGFGRGFVGGRHSVDSLNESSQTRRLLEVRFGSQAVVRHHIRRLAAFGVKPAVREADFQNSYLNVCFTQKRSFRSSETRIYDRQLTAEAASKLA